MRTGLAVRRLVWCVSLSGACHFAYAAPMATSKTTAKNRMPAALAKRAATAAQGKIARLVAEAKEDIALIQRRRAEISDAFYDIGEALVRLKRREIVAAMGCRSFAELCEQQIGISSSQADRLVDVVTSMTRMEALSVCATKAASIVALVRATPEDDTASELLSRGAHVRGKVLDVKKASSRAIARIVPRTEDAAAAAHLIEDVLPTGVPLRQWVLTVPFAWRKRLGYDARWPLRAAWWTSPTYPDAGPIARGPRS